MATPKRLIPRLLTALVKKAELISWTSYIVGFAAVLLLPALGNNNHISENAIMAGSARPKFGHGDAVYAIRIAGEIKQAAKSTSAECGGVQRWIARELGELGLTTVFHSTATTTESSPFSLTTSKAYYDQGGPPTTSHCGGTNVVGILKAPKGEGTEAIVLVTPLRQLAQSDGRGNLTEGDALALGLSFAVMRVLAGAPWLARDIIWLVADARGGLGPYAGISQWLEEYHFPSIHAPNASSSSLSSSSSPSSSSHDFMRSGTISHAVVVEADGSYIDGAFDLVQLRAEGPNGAMPNLDLVVTAQQLATWREGLSFEIETSEAVAASQAVSVIGSIVESVGGVLGMFDRKWALDNRESYVHRAAALAKFMANQVMGIPTGLHGAFRDYQIDAITLRFMPTTATASLSSAASSRATQQLSTEKSASFYRAGRTVESLVRCLNNLLESFHHASSLYVLVGGDRFVPISTYIIPFFLLLLGLPLKAASLGIYGDLLRSKGTATKSATAGATSSPVLLPWGDAVEIVARIYGWALCSAMMISLLVEAGSKVKNHSSVALRPMQATICFLLSSIALGLVFRKRRSSNNVLASALGDGTREEHIPRSNDKWMAVKALLLLSTGIGLGAITCINFSLALIYEIVLVPLCLLAHPLRLTFGDRASAAVLWGFFPTAVAVCAIIGVGDVWVALWRWVEVHCWWGSAMFTYTMLGFLPSCVLCAYIFLS